MKLSIIFCLIIFFASCNSEDVGMGIFEINHKKIGYKALEKKGFKKSPVDVMMFEKQNGDTVVTFEFDYELRRLNSKGWNFTLPNNYIDSLKLLFEKCNNYLMIPDAYEKIRVNEFFCIKGFDDNRVFFCLIEHDDKINKINIIYYYPPP